MLTKYGAQRNHRGQGQIDQHMCALAYTHMHAHNDALIPSHACMCSRTYPSALVHTLIHVLHPCVHKHIHWCARACSPLQRSPPPLHAHNSCSAVPELSLLLLLMMLSFHILREAPTCGAAHAPHVAAVQIPIEGSRSYILLQYVTVVYYIENTFQIRIYGVIRNMATGGSVLYPCFRTHIFYVYYTPTGLANPGLLAVQFADMATKLRNIKTTCVTLVTTHDACKLHCRVDHKTHWHTGFG